MIVSSIVPLLALPLLCGIIVYLRLRLNNLSKKRRVWLIILRSLVIALFLFAICEPRMTLNFSRGIIVYAVDLSESVSEVAKEEALGTIEKESDEYTKKGYSVAMLGFAGNTQILSGLSSQKIEITEKIKEKALYKSTLKKLSKDENAALIAQINSWKTSIQVDATNLGNLCLAARLLAENNLERLIIFTDGNANLDEISSELFPYISFVPLDQKENDLEIVNVRVPPSIHFSEPFNMDLVINSNYQTDAQVDVLIDDVQIKSLTQKIKIYNSKEQVITIKNIQGVEPLSKGLHTIQAIITGTGDSEPRNNKTMAATYVLSSPKVLIVTDKPDKSLAEPFESYKIDADIIYSADIQKVDLYRYDALIFEGDSIANLPALTVSDIKQYISRFGRGLFVIANGQVPSKELEELLPVLFLDTDQITRSKSSGETGSEVLAHQIALLLVIDRSGSMAGLNIALAKEACIATVKTLSAEDYIGIVAFDTRAHDIVPLTKAKNISTIEWQILRLYADGGTNIYNGLYRAYETLNTIKAGIKHVILFSDGLTPAADFKALLSKMMESNITVSTVCLWQGEYDAVLMHQIAELGRGRSFPVANPKRLPQIFTSEAKFIMKKTEDGKAAHDYPSDQKTVEQPAGSFFIKFKDPHEVLTGLSASDLPPVQRISRSRSKELSSVPLVTAQDENPLLAIWNFGLGKVAVWTADLAKSSKTDKLFAQVMRFLTNSIADTKLSSRISIDAKLDKMLLTIDSIEGEELQAFLASPVARELNLKPSDRNRMSATIDLEEPGIIYRVSVRNKDEQIELGVALPYERELYNMAMNKDFFDKANLLKGPPPRREFILNLTPISMIIALILLVADLALRRLK